MYVLNTAMFYDSYINIAVYFKESDKYMLLLQNGAKLGATVIFNRISRVDVNISLEELFRSNIEDRGNDVKLVKVKVGEERGGLWSDIDIDGSENLPETQIFRNWNWNFLKSDKVLYTILFRHSTYDRQHIHIRIHMTDKYYCKCVFNPCFVKWIYIRGD